MAASLFSDKRKIPTHKDLQESIPAMWEVWLEIENYVRSKYPKVKEEWNFPGEKYGWNFRMKDSKRAILYFLPREDYFIISMVFGQKATDIILESKIAEELKTELKNARKYAEGRGLQILFEDKKFIQDVKELINIKLTT